MKVLLISTYELGHQPLGIAAPRRMVPRAIEILRATVVEARADDAAGDVFKALRELVDLDPIDVSRGAAAPRLSEPRFCCAEPTSVQLRSI